MSILRIKNSNGEWIDIPAIKGADGKDGEVTLEQLKNITGELEDLSTEDKSNLVNAINEVLSNAGSGDSGGSGGLPELSGSIAFSDFNLEPEKTTAYFAKEDVTITGITTIKTFTFPKGCIFYIRRYSKSPITESGGGWYWKLNSDIHGFGVAGGTGSEHKKSFLSYDSTPTIKNQWTFNVIPKTEIVPTVDTHLVNKKYVDDLIGELETGSSNSGSSSDNALSVVLYDNPEGSKGEITLSDSANNYDYLEIYYATDVLSIYGYKKIYSPNEKTVDMYLCKTDNAGWFTNIGENITINGNTIIRNGAGQYNVRSDNKISDFGSSTESQIVIVRVVGCKNSNNVYSTEEQVIGTYRDGKTLYRKVVVATLDGSWKENNVTYSWIDLGVKVDKVPRLDVSLTRNWEFTFTEASNKDMVVSLRNGRGGITTTELQVGLTTSMFANQEIDIVIEYTKATE